MTAHQTQELAWDGKDLAVQNIALRPREGSLEDQTPLACNQVPSLPIRSTSQINTAVVMDGVFASQHRGPRHLRQMHTAPEILDGLRNFLPNPSSAHVSGSLMLICLDCALRGPVLLQIQCGWIYKQRKWNTLHKHLLIVSKYYFLAFPPTPPPIIFRNKTIQALLFGRMTASLVQSRSGKLGPL